MITDVQKKLDRAYTLISGITVSGANVKRLAMAMQELEDAFKLLSDTEKEEDNG